MARKIVRTLLDQLRLTDEEDEFDEEDEEVKPVKINKRIKNQNENAEKETPSSGHDRRDNGIKRDDAQFGGFEDARYQNRQTSIRKPAFDRPNTRNSSGNGYMKYNTAIPYKNASESVLIVNPRTFEDAQGICDTLRMGGVVFINFEGVNLTLAQRLMDFAGGSVYALEGQIYQISGTGFLVAPADKEIDGDIINQITEAGFDIPAYFN